MTVREVCRLFHEFNRNTWSAKTVRFYEQRLRKFEARFGDFELTAVTTLLLLEFFAQTDKGLKDTTKRHNRVAIERLQSFALDHDLIPERLWKKLKKPPAGKRERVPTEAETEQLLAVASMRFRLIYSALRACGARPGEMCSASLSDWRRDEGFIVLREHKTARKTRKPRRIPVSEVLAALLDESLAGRAAEPSSPLFVTDRGKRWTSPHLSRTYTRTRRAAGLPDGLVLYLARHEAGTALCKAHGILIASRVLGHSNVSTTQRYVHPDDAELVEACKTLGKLPTTTPPAPTAPPPEPPKPDPVREQKEPKRRKTTAAAPGGIQKGLFDE